MTAEECIDHILEIVSRPIEVSTGPEFHVDGSSTTIVFPGGKDTMEQLIEIARIIRIYKEEK